MAIGAALPAALFGMSLSGALAAPDLANVAPCEKAIIGHGSADWRRSSLVAGPVGVRRHPLSAMTRTGAGLVAKMPLLVEARAPSTVTVSVPPRLRQRVFLLYGRAEDRDGNPSTSFRNTRGYSETEFQPCDDKPRTIWPGAIRVRGARPVFLLVAVEGRPEPIPIFLGRPKAFGG
jgi:hypothetical protein